MVSARRDVFSRNRASLFAYETGTGSGIETCRLRDPGNESHPRQFGQDAHGKDRFQRSTSNLTSLCDFMINFVYLNPIYFSRSFAVGYRPKPSS